MFRLTIETKSRMEMIDVTADVRRIVRDGQVTRGMCHLFVPHTTAGMTINEHTDPNARGDMIENLVNMVPLRDGRLQAEGNAAAHLLSSLVGVSKSIPFENGKLALGTWQAIYLCEFDGPRSRTVVVHVMAG